MAPVAPNSSVESSLWNPYDWMLKAAASQPVVQAADVPLVSGESDQPQVPVIEKSNPQGILNLFKKDSVKTSGDLSVINATLLPNTPLRRRDFLSLSVEELAELKPAELSNLVDAYKQACWVEAIEHMISIFPHDTQMPLSSVLGLMPAEMAESLAPLAQNHDVTVEMSREQEQHNAADMLMAGGAVAGYRLVIRYKGDIINGVKQLPTVVKNGAINVKNKVVNLVENPAVPIWGIQGLLYIYMDQRLAQMGVPDHWRGPALMATHVTANLGADALEWAVFNKPFSAAGYKQMAEGMPAYYLSFKGASYLLNQAGLEYNTVGNQLGSFAISATATKPMLNGLKWATQNTILGLAGLSATVKTSTLKLTSEWGARSVAMKVIPKVVAHIGGLVGSGLLAGAAKFLGKAKNVLNPLAWGLLAADVYYGVKDGTSEGIDKEINMARDSLIDEAHWGVTNFFLGSAFKLTTSDDEITERRSEIRAQLKEYIDHFDAVLWQATAEYALKAEKFNKADYAAFLKQKFEQNESEDNLKGLKVALETFVSLGEERFKVLDHLNSDNRFDGSTMAYKMAQNITNEKNKNETAFKENLVKMGLVTLNDKGAIVSVSKTRLSALSPEALGFLLGTSGDSYLALLNKTSALAALDNLMQGHAYALSDAQKQAVVDL